MAYANSPITNITVPIRQPKSVHFVLVLVIYGCSLFFINQNTFIIKKSDKNVSRVITHFLQSLQFRSFFINIFVKYYNKKMAEAVKAINKMSKRLEQMWTKIAYWSSRHLAYSDKYGSQYMVEYKKILSKIKKDQLKKSSKHKLKHKTERDKLKKQLQQAKAMNKAKSKQKKDRQENSSESSKSEDSRSRSNSKSRQKQRERQKRRQRQRQRQRQRPKQKSRRSYLDRINQKDNHREIERSKYKPELIKDKKQQKKKQKQLYDQYRKEKTELDFQRDFDYKKPLKQTKKDNSIYEEPESSRRQSVIKVKKTSNKWSSHKPQSIGCQDPQKYKILKVEEQASDFQDQDAIEKVPIIKPRQPLTPYFLFLRFNKRTISKGYPNLNLKSQLREIWKNLPAEQKKPYVEEYERAQKIYAKKLTQYHAVNPKGAEQKNKIRKEIEEITDREKDEQKKKQQGKGKKNKSKDAVDKTASSRKRGAKSTQVGSRRGRKKKDQATQNDSD